MSANFVRSLLMHDVFRPSFKITEILETARAKDPQCETVPLAFAFFGGHKTRVGWMDWWHPGDGDGDCDDGRRMCNTHVRINDARSTEKGKRKRYTNIHDKKSRPFGRTFEACIRRRIQKNERATQPARQLGSQSKSKQLPTPRTHILCRRIDRAISQNQNNNNNSSNKNSSNIDRKQLQQ